MVRDGLLPYMFARVGSHNLVFFIDPHRLDWKQGFFHRALPDEAEPDAMMPLAQWIAKEEHHPADFTGFAAISHVARCGSTLLAENIKATGQAVVLSEPPFFRILRHLLDGTVEPSQAVNASAKMVAAWKRWAENDGKRLVIKFSSQTHRHHDQLCRAMSGGRYLFLFREPVAVLESYERSVPAYLRREIRDGETDLLEELEGIDGDPVVAAGVNRYCRALERYSDQQNASEIAVEYADLETAFPAILTHFGLQADSAAWSQDMYAKADRAKGDVPYVPVSAERMAGFAADNAPLLAVAKRHYDIFRSKITVDC